MTSLPTPARWVLCLALIAAGIALLLLGQPSPGLLGIASLWLAGLLVLSLRRGGDARTDVSSSG